ncbi:unnamed protein product [Spodoptera littoralis]|uniref:Uncharacterized protein n=1 Tax=Spodoptera littoralis TaxID=7109 RepID=A0A9P0IC65_SPOLI|nr:unnamed protein product [Spodoptera littoralis]CAH1644053.1 unnamed protein product [Spodoptera littoralis]
MKDLTSIDGDYNDGVSYHDLHNYTVIYLLASALCAAGAVHVWRRLRRVRSVALQALPPCTPRQQLQSASVISVNELSEPGDIELSAISSACKQNRATSPMLRESILS